MTAARPKYMPEPRLLDRDQAATYCGLSGDLFERYCPVQPRRFGSGAHPRKLWDRIEIDSWLDGNAASSQSNPILGDWLRGENANAR